MEIEIYETSSGKMPFEIWLDKIKDTSIRARILTRLERLRLGNFGDCKSLGSGICELRLQYGAGLRIYYSKLKDTLSYFYVEVIKVHNLVIFKKPKST